ncbi:glycine oxidase ThiO [Aquipseudomonas alcaligenes]|uniref:Glycine oxidase ThiO n=1 Tax=Aquipseudomonas alcaligenes TaxID=43263 RepID=A0AA42N406_AQUAC|nr:glycine oxidase ThiO [Pseudomonas alcaligenes]MDH1056052.1 glycine oxidase ThiO [Pseudomonas alcaligenes]
MQLNSTLVVGGGVIGLLGALELARAGEPVLLLERADVGLESSWAGGGIVSPLYPWRYDAAVGALARWSQDFYPKLAHRLLATTEIDPEVHVTGLYWLDLQDELDALGWAGQGAYQVRRVALEMVREAVPPLGGGFTSAIHMAAIANVRNPRLLKALRAALTAMSNVTLLERTEVQGFLCDGERVAGVLVPSGEIRSERVVLSAGAWSGRLLATLGLQLPVEPVKGQMILYKCEPDFLPAIVLAKGRYAIPRKDGHILVGSTLEHVGFDKTPTEEALASLKASAEELLPALADAEVVGHWAGLRPGSPDGIPFIGEVPQFPGLWLNCGHYRNGLVLAPASCELLKNLMLGEAPIVDPAPYAPAGRLGLV